MNMATDGRTAQIGDRLGLLPMILPDTWGVMSPSMTVEKVLPSGRILCRYDEPQKKPGDDFGPRDRETVTLIPDEGRAEHGRICYRTGLRSEYVRRRGNIKTCDKYFLQYPEDIENDAERKRRDVQYRENSEAERQERIALNRPAFDKLYTLARKLDLYPQRGGGFGSRVLIDLEPEPDDPEDTNRLLDCPPEEFAKALVQIPLGSVIDID